MKKLITLNGAANMTPEERILQVDDYSAGLIALKEISKELPDTTIAELLQGNYEELMGRKSFWGRMARRTKNLARKTGNLTSNILNSKAGQLVIRGAAAAATGGASEASGQGEKIGKSGGMFQKFISSFGKSAKQSIQKIGITPTGFIQPGQINQAAAGPGMKINPVYIMAALGGVVGLVLLTRGKKK